MRQILIVFMCAVIAGSVTVRADWVDDTNRQVNAWKNRDYRTALNYLLRIRNNPIVYVGVNFASECFEAAMLYWNLGDKSQAVAEVNRGINTLRRDQYTGGTGCEAAALKFLAKMRSNDLPAEFSYYDTYDFGILGYITAAPRAVYNKKIGQEIDRWRRLGQMLDSQMYSLQLRSEAIERELKRNARHSYQRSTGDTFSPNNPPAYGTEKRAEWEACKRTFDLFD